MNIYVNRIKNDIRGFADKTAKAQAQAEQNAQRFLPETATKENEALWAELNKEYVRLKTEIIDTFTEIKTALSLASAPTAEAVSGERIFFNGEFPITVTPQEFVIFSDMHPSNFLWQRFLLDQITKADADKESGMTSYTDVRRMIENRLPENIVHAYVKIFEGALSMLDTAMQGKVNDAVFDAWMNEESGFSAELFAAIGDGQDIAQYKHRSLPESAKHQFDSVVLHEQNGQEAQKAPTHTFSYASVR